jgi:hypothetical protein
LAVATLESDFTAAVGKKFAEVNDRVAEELWLMV